MVGNIENIFTPNAKWEVRILNPDDPEILLLIKEVQEKQKAILESKILREETLKIRVTI